jgi:hypothetical protein
MRDDRSHALEQVALERPVRVRVDDTGDSAHG